MDLSTLSPEERKRMLAILQQDAQYAKSRNWLMAISAICTVCLAAVGMMLMYGAAPVWATVTAISICLPVYVFALARVVKSRKTALGRLSLAQAGKRPSKKERRNKAR